MASGLQDLFSKSQSQFSSANASLKYREKPANQAFNNGNSEDGDSNSSNNSGAIAASVVILYRYENSSPIDLGKKGAAIVANADNNSFCLICYEVKSRKLLLSITIHSNFILNVLTKNFIAFYDSKSNYFSMRFPNEAAMTKFVTAIAMSKIPKIAAFNHSKQISVQDLNKIENGQTYDERHLIINTDLQIWLCDLRNHPFSKGPMVFNSEKVIKLNSDKILPALSKALKSIKLNMKRLIVTSSHYGFAEKGNKTLNIPPNAPLIIQITIKSIDKPAQVQTPQVQTTPTPTPTPTSPTKERMAKLSAATGGTMLAMLVNNSNHHSINPSVSSNASITSDNHEGGVYRQAQPQPQPQPQPPPPQLYYHAQLQPQPQPITLLSLDRKLTEISSQLSFLSSPINSGMSRTMSSKEIILTLNEICTDLSDNKEVINSQKLEISTLSSRVSKLQSRNHELLEKNNALMEQQYKNMSSEHSQTQQLREENQRLSQVESRSTALQSENEAMKEKLNRLLTSLNAKQSELTTAQAQMMDLKSRNRQLSDSKEENRNKVSDVNDILIEKNEAIRSLAAQISALQSEKQTFETLRNANNSETLKLTQTIRDLEKDNTALSTAQNELSIARELSAALQHELSESKSESKEILNQSKKHIEKMKKKFEMHQIDLIKRILEFVYIKYDENVKSEEQFNYISFFRSITKEILANPNEFDYDSDSENAEENV